MIYLVFRFAECGGRPSGGRGRWLDDGHGNGKSDSGAVYLFRLDDTNFSGGTLSGVIGDGYTGGNNVTVGLDGDDRFGVSVSLNASGDRLAVGARFDDGHGNTRGTSGAVYLFRFSDTDFSGGTSSGVIGDGSTGGNNVTVGLDSSDRFGASVSLNAVGDRLAVGAVLDSGLNNATSGNGSGAVYLFTDNTATPVSPTSTPHWPPRCHRQRL